MSLTSKSIISILRTDLSTISPIITNIDNSDMSTSCKILFDDVIPCIRDRTKYYDDNSDVYEKTVEVLETDITSIVKCLEKMPSTTTANCLITFNDNCCLCVYGEGEGEGACEYYDTCLELFSLTESDGYC